MGITGVYSVNSSWQNNNSQIDLVIDRDDNRINLCEIKFSSAPFTISKDYFEKLKKKYNEFKNETATRKGVFFTFITTYGITQNSWSLSITEDNITMDILFEKELFE